MEIICFKLFLFKVFGYYLTGGTGEKKKRYQREILELEGISYQNQESLITYQLQKSPLLLK